MGYKIGAVGMGHWFERLQRSILRGGRISVLKAVGLKPYEEKKEILEKYGIPKDNYFQVKPYDSLPSKFFDGLDVIYIASPNQFHADQLIQSVDHGKFVVVEKTFAVNREEFKRVIDYLRNNKKPNNVHLHLHYLRKALTASLPSLLLGAIREYGKITSVAATFFEQENSEDRRRTWILKSESGGIFMDWIHPIEVLYKQCGAVFGDCKNAKLLIINPEYDPINPTAVEAVFGVQGPNFVQDATVTIRVGKGFPHGITCKTIRFYLETGGFLDINYTDSEQEYNSDFRGTWQLGETNDGKIKGVEGGMPSGMTPYEYLVYDTVNMIEGGKSLLSLDDIEKLYDPQWKFQDISRNLKPTSNGEDVQKFIRSGLEKLP